jgi:hypothetical protein
MLAILQNKRLLTKKTTSLTRSRVTPWTNIMESTIG